MRKIKFRVRRGNKIIGYEILMDGIWFASDKGVDWADGTYRSDIRGNILERDQFSGLYDKNWKEIYEGDILKRPDGVVGVVYWDEENAGFEVISSNTTGIYSQHEEEVIGNIYENPELLGG